jgi:hypothetical protein
VNGRPTYNTGNSIVTQSRAPNASGEEYPQLDFSSQAGPANARGQMRLSVHNGNFVAAPHQITGSWPAHGGRDGDSEMGAGFDYHLSGCAGHQTKRRVLSTGGSEKQGGAAAWDCPPCDRDSSSTSRQAPGRSSQVPALVAMAHSTAVTMEQAIAGAKATQRQIRPCHG